MLTLSEKLETFWQMLPWILLVGTWLWMFLKHEERKDARKEQNNG